MENKYTVDDFKFGSIICEESGSWERSYIHEGNGEYSINYSSILTRLIQAAGRVCKFYASDLFIDWEIIHEKLSDECFEGDKFLFGFRESGVDSADFVINKLNTWGIFAAKGEIEELYRIDIQVERNAVPRIKMIFGEAEWPEKC